MISPRETGYEEGFFFFPFYYFNICRSVYFLEALELVCMIMAEPVDPLTANKIIIFISNGAGLLFLGVPLSHRSCGVK